MLSSGPAVWHTSIWNRSTQSLLSPYSAIYPILPSAQFRKKKKQTKQIMFLMDCNSLNKIRFHDHVDMN